MPKHNFGQNLKFESAGVSLKKKPQGQGNLNLIILTLFRLQTVHLQDLWKST